MVDKGFSVIHACKAAMSFLSKEVSGLHFALVSPSCDPHPPLSLFPEEQFVPNAPTRKNVSPDLANGKGTGPSPALGRNRGGSFVQRTHFLEHLRPSAKVKSLVEISPCSCVSFFDTDDPSHVPNTYKIKPHAVKEIAPRPVTPASQN